MGWIKPVKLVAELNRPTDIFCMSSMEAISEKDTILIAIHDSSSKTHYFRYNTTKDQWKKVEVPDGTPIKTQSKKTQSGK
ncbi:hypothetical protein MNBD_PLANCTO02-2400 [hydrothermal vent metagenome]|uniref:Uncharacterized protein n=1 Tax=hydrothermal vent metagenome TaxID=652676 RepID=A0A3B1DQV5_9ZZZZ